MRSRYGRYEVLSKLGQGAMAQVFLARDPVLTRLVAVKVLHADLAERKDVLQRFFNEARTVAMVRNAHVVEVFDFGQEGNDLFLVMEFVDGVSLQGMLRRQPADQGPAAAGGPGTETEPGSQAIPPPGAGQGIFSPLDATLVAALMCQAAEGLSIAARHGVVHRDIKPENLMINRQGYLKISDFGIAHVQDDSLTKTGAVLGSPLFMSPEQARGLKPITSQADMFSLGSVFYCCLAGRPPFQGRNVADLVRKIATHPHEPLWKLRPDADPILGSLVETMLRKDPAQRGGGPRWLHRHLKEYLAGQGTPDPAEVIADRLRSGAGLSAQSTWRMDALETGQSPMPSATEPFTRGIRRRSASGPSRWILISLAIAVAVAGGIFGLAILPGQGGSSGVVAGPETLRSGREAIGLKSQSAGRITPGAAPSGHDVGSRMRRAAFVDSGTVGHAASMPDQAGNLSLDSGMLFREGELLEAPGLPPAHERVHAGFPPPVVLSLRSSPPFADVFVDGHYRGVTPIRMELEASGSHRVLLRVKDVPELDTILALGPGSHDLKLRLDFDALARMEGEPDSGE